MSIKSSAEAPIPVRTAIHFSPDDIPLYQQMCELVNSLRLGPDDLSIPKDPQTGELQTSITGTPLQMQVLTLGIDTYHIAIDKGLRDTALAAAMNDFFYCQAAAHSPRY